MTVESEEAVDALVARVGRAGGAVVAAAEHLPWGYGATWTDPDGHVWQVTVAPPEA